MEMKKVLVIFGTRPEVIKLAPVIQELTRFNVSICFTGQHDELAKQAMSFFNIKPDYELNVMTENQSLTSLSTTLLEKLDYVVQDFEPGLIIVQGDTTTALMGAVIGYYHKVKVAHIEAGLRTDDKYAPFPEEINRRLIDHISDYRFTPTVVSAYNLEKEGLIKNGWCVGNTGIDALLMGLDNVSMVTMPREYILVTCHRRENFGNPLKRICKAVKRIARQIDIVFIVHPNPNVKKFVYKYLGKEKNISIIEGVSYGSLVEYMRDCEFIITDSGGLQEEAPTLKKPVLVIRDKTERVEGLGKVSILVGTKTNNIVKAAKRLLTDEKYYNSFISNENPYGDGNASKKIAAILEKVK